MRTKAIELVFSLDGISAKVAWNNVVDLQLLAKDTELSLYEHPVKASEIAGLLARSNKNHFDIHGEQIAFRFCSVAQFRHSFLEIQFAFDPSISECEMLVSAFPSSALVSGRLYDVEYERWQNAEDPLEYTSQGRTFAGLKTFRDPVFGEVRIDISAFPGRRVLRDGFVEAVGSPMWLTPEFERRTGIVLEELKSQSWCHVSQASEQLYRIDISESCFTSAKGIELELQERLRAALFPSAQ